MKSVFLQALILGLVFQLLTCTSVHGEEQAEEGRHKKKSKKKSKKVWSGSDDDDDDDYRRGGDTWRWPPAVFQRQWSCEGIPLPRGVWDRRAIDLVDEANFDYDANNVDRCSIRATYTMDGTCNSQFDSPEAGGLLQRFAPAVHSPSDSTTAPGSVLFSDRPNSCKAESLVLTEEQPNAQGLSSLIWAFGQFSMSHDTAITEGTDDNNRVFTFSGLGQGESDACFGNNGFKRSDFELVNGKKEYVNEITSFLDMGNVYGDSVERCETLRLFRDGLLKSHSDAGYPPRHCYHIIPMAADPFRPNADPNDLYCVGDVRGNENAGLLSMHLLFYRNHNRLATILKHRHPDWTDDQLFYKSRAINVAQYQNIIYYEYLPAMLGKGYDKVIGPYDGHKPNVNPGTFLEFSTAVCRMNRGFVNENLIGPAVQEGLSGNRIFNLVQDLFFNPRLLIPYDSQFVGMNSVLSMLTKNFAGRIGRVPSTFKFIHLWAIDVIRGRDLGVPPYNAFRQALGLSPASDAADITSDPDFASVIEEWENEDSSLDNLDLFVGGTLEDPETDKGSAFGETFIKFFGFQLKKTRDGDRFYFENPDYTFLTEEEKQYARATRMSHLILLNTDMECIQRNAFYVSDENKICKRDMCDYNNVNGGDIYAYE